MPYKYEDMVVKEMQDLGCDLEQTNYFDVSKELKEVYQKARLLDDIVTTTKRRLSVQERKAKAFDEIREIEIQSDITGYHDNTESYMYEVESVIEKYEEDNSDDRR